MTVKIFPTVNDVGGGGAGKIYTEANVTALIKQIISQNFVVSGFTVPGNSANLTLSVALGEANIAGYRVVIDAATDVNCTANQTNHIFLKLTRDGLQNVTGATFEVNTTGTAPADSVKISTAVAGASSISSTVDARPFSSWDAAKGHKHTGVAGDGPKLSGLSASGTFSDTTSVIAAGATLTKTIPLGISATHGTVIIRGDTSGGALIHFNTTANDATALFDIGSTTAFFNRLIDGSLSGGTSGGSVGAELIVLDAYISGTGLIISFKSISALSQTLKVQAALWQVW